MGRWGWMGRGWEVGGRYREAWGMVGSCWFWELSGSCWLLLVERFCEYVPGRTGLGNLGRVRE